MQTIWWRLEVKCVKKLLRNDKSRFDDLNGDDLVLNCLSRHETRTHNDWLLEGLVWRVHVCVLRSGTMMARGRPIRKWHCTESVTRRVFPIINRKSRFLGSINISPFMKTPSSWYQRWFWWLVPDESGKLSNVSNAVIHFTTIQAAVEQTGIFSLA